jgi:hypothetical protein
VRSATQRPARRRGATLGGFAERAELLSLREEARFERVQLEHDDDEQNEHQREPTQHRVAKQAVVLHSHRSVTERL